ncbi:hypothetical protein NLU13_6819 [Sarocladium strictum]|uniref:Uncharacterized protein n=1 Tax=Sarocladium strictum TaxID=5046 RepID=A0AA39GE39_SARSR|nr:hypothetical protein NLU13_6819 [Sarocladium strictum]
MSVAISCFEDVPLTRVRRLEALLGNFVLASRYLIPEDDCDYEGLIDNSIFADGWDSTKAVADLPSSLSAIVPRERTFAAGTYFPGGPATAEEQPFFIKPKTNADGTISYTYFDSSGQPLHYHDLFTCEFKPELVEDGQIHAAAVYQNEKNMADHVREYNFARLKAIGQRIAVGQDVPENDNFIVLGPKPENPLKMNYWDLVFFLQ